MNSVGWKPLAVFFLHFSFFILHFSFFICRASSALVGLDGLEPSTSRLSGVRSNHLSYKPFPSLTWYWFQPSSSPFGSRHCRVVEMMGIEPMTPCLQGRCSPSWATPPYLRVCSFSMISNNRQVVFDPWKLNNKSSILASLKPSLVNRLRALREKNSWSP